MNRKIIVPLVALLAASCQGKSEQIAVQDNPEPATIEEKVNGPVRDDYVSMSKTMCSLPADERLDYAPEVFLQYLIDNDLLANPIATEKLNSYFMGGGKELNARFGHWEARIYRKGVIKLELKHGDTTESFNQRRLQMLPQDCRRVTESDHGSSSSSGCYFASLLHFGLGRAMATGGCDEKGRTATQYDAEMLISPDIVEVELQRVRDYKVAVELFARQI